ncbi:hypothetical protein GCK72_007956 [Caenorhabditis remanei]|uniref:DUF38 domain-containing protein n=1 Tax=Caenorhabditis remanei TaxID=31234 RepID=A0A6A5HKE1_CAERE|nr:hypothetical protein GCK72_007956 [Caenorhabditis remanei]KAF1767995.1 hypothetical protein GCK72_007956 [Caenorhabditis remanei]
MTSPLTYPSLKCILENLEATRRLHITARTPSLQKINNQIPLRFDSISINSDSLKINELSIEFRWSYMYFSQMEYLMKRNISGSPDEKMEKLLNKYFCGRSNLHVDTLDLGPGTVPAMNIKLRVNSLKPSVDHYFEPALFLLHPDSFPLKTLKTTVIGPETYEHPVVKSAETLILSIGPDEPPIPLETIKKLTNTTVVFHYLQYPMTKFDVIGLTKYLRANPSEHSTIYNITSEHFLCVHNLLFQLGIAFNEFGSELTGVQGRFIPTTFRLLIPTDEAKTQIQVYGIVETDQWRLVIKVVK